MKNSVNKLYNLQEMYKLLESHILPTLKQEEIENMNGPITSKELKQLSKIFQQTGVQGQMASLGDSIKHLKKN